MSRKLYVHVGPTKTGTSAIQSILSRHDNSVVVYPKIGLWGPGAHHALVYAMRGKSRGGDVVDNADEWLPSIAECVASNDRNLVFSSEEFLPPPGRRHSRGRPVEFVEKILGGFESKMWEVEFLVTCREHFERAASAYSQRLKGNGSTEVRSPDDFLTDSIDSLSLARVTKPIRESGYKLTGLSYHPQDTFVSRFLIHIGFSAGQLPAIPKINQSLSVKALIAKLAANRVIAEKPKREAFSEALKKIPGYYGPSEFIFGKAAVGDVERSFANDRTFVREQFGIELPRVAEPQSNMFRISRQEVNDISTAAAVLGPEKQSLLDAVAAFVDG